MCVNCVVDTGWQDRLLGARLSKRVGLGGGGMLEAGTGGVKV